jgi:hypothetical protein
MDKVAEEYHMMPFSVDHIPVRSVVSGVEQARHNWPRCDDSPYMDAVKAGGPAGVLLAAHVALRIGGYGGGCSASVRFVVEFFSEFHHRGFRGCFVSVGFSALFIIISNGRELTPVVDVYVPLFVSMYTDLSKKQHLSDCPGSVVVVKGFVAVSGSEHGVAARGRGDRGAWRSVAVEISQAGGNLFRGADLAIPEGGVAHGRSCRQWFTSSRRRTW